MTLWLHGGGERSTQTRCVAQGFCSGVEMPEADVSSFFP